MSLIPFILDLADELHDFNRCLATGMDVDDFGFGIYPHEFQQQQLQQQQQLRRPRAVSQLYWLPNTKQRHHPYYRSKACCGNKTPSSQLNDPEKEAASDKDGAAPNTGTAAGKSAYSVVNRNGFQVSMNVKQFTPNELTVKTIDNCIVVEGRHEDKEDGHGVISRHFIRKYMLPKGYDPNEVLSTLSSDGILTVKAPPPATKADEHSERIVDIQQTGPAQTNAAAKDTSKEQTNTTKAAAAEAVAAVAAAAPPPQQQQPLELQKPKQKQQPEQQNVVTERNGDSNSKEMNAEQETEPEPAAAAVAASEPDGEQPMLVSNIVVAPAAIDAIMAAATADEGNEQDANVNNNTNNDNGIADIPVAIASDVDMETVTNTEAASATVVAVVEELVDGVTDGASVVVVEAAVENLVVAEKAPTAADLIAAADAAIILAKTQCENGNKTATASSEEGVAN